MCLSQQVRCHTLNFSTATTLGFVNNAYNLQSGAPTATPDFFTAFADPFQGIGKLASFQCKLHVDPSVSPKGINMPYQLRTISVCSLHAVAS